MIFVEVEKSETPVGPLPFIRASFRFAGRPRTQPQIVMMNRKPSQIAGLPVHPHRFVQLLRENDVSRPVAEQPQLPVRPPWLRRDVTAATDNPSSRTPEMREFVGG